jgi:hypothetical protein
VSDGLGSSPVSVPTKTGVRKRTGGAVLGELLGRMGPASAGTIVAEAAVPAAAPWSDVAGLKLEHAPAPASLAAVAAAEQQHPLTGPAGVAASSAGIAAVLTALALGLRRRLRLADQ